MKRKLFSVLLCVSMLLLSACNKTGESKDPTPTPLPPNEAEVFLNNAVSNIKNKISTISTVKDKASGYDLSIDLNVNEKLAAIIGLDQIRQVNISLSSDSKENSKINVVTSVDKKELIEADFILSSENIYFNLPGYSDEYACVPLKEIIASIKTEDFDFETITKELPDVSQLTKSINEYLSELIGCFKPEMEFERNVEIGIEGYKLKGTKYTMTAKAVDVANVLEKISEEINGYAEKTNGINPNMTINKESIEEDQVFTLNYYVGKDNETAWELLNGKESSIVYISSTKGIRLYTVEDGNEETILYTTKDKQSTGVVAQSKTTGKIIFVNPNGTGEDFELKYMGDKDDFKITYEISETDSIAVNYKKTLSGYDGAVIITNAETEVSVTVKKNDVTTSIVAKIINGSEELLILKITGVERAYREITIPSETLTVEEWSEELDVEKIEEIFTDVLGESLFQPSYNLGTDMIYEIPDIPTESPSFD